MGRGTSTSYRTGRFSSELSHSAGYTKSIFDWVQLRRWYFRHTDVSGELRQIYVGPDNERTRALIGRDALDTVAPDLEAETWLRARKKMTRTRKR